METTKQAKAIMGPDKKLVVVVRVVLDTDPVAARDLARKACGWYMSQTSLSKDLEVSGVR